MNGSVPCINPLLSRGVCSGHYWRLTQKGSLFEEVPLRSIQKDKDKEKGAQCGTYAGAAVHKRQAKALCEPCRIAVAENARRLYRKPRDEIFDLLFEVQGRRCAICGTSDPGKREWHLDHDHNCCRSPKICPACARGVLCMGCNLGLGNFKDNKNALRKAIAYLEDPPRRKLVGG